MLPYKPIFSNMPLHVTHWSLTLWLNTVTFPFDMADLKREGKGFAYKVKMNVAVYSEEVTYYTYTYYLLIIIFLRDPDTGLKFISKQW